jgi:hypothetical protein
LAHIVGPQGNDLGKAVFEAVRVEENADQVVNGQKPVANVKFLKAHSFVLDVIEKEERVSRARLLMLAAEADISVSTLENALRNTPHVKHKDGVLELSIRYRSRRKMWW